jgi:hypothetical protein
MGRAKDIRVKVIPSKIANDFVKKHHYSGSVAFGSCLNFGSFLDGQLHGVSQFGPPIDKRKVIDLVKDGCGKNAGWNGFLELNRMAFDDVLPKNSESRSLGVIWKLLKKNAPQVKWVLSFADGTRCGDGAIYRGAGFSLTAVKKNKSMMILPNGTCFNEISTRQRQGESLRRKIGFKLGYTLKQFCERSGAKPIEGFQLRYIKTLNNDFEITCPILPFSKIDEMNARMYKGVKQSPRSIDSDATGSQPVDGGATPTLGLLSGGKDAI